MSTPDPGGTIAFAYVTDGAAPTHKTMTLMSVGGTLSATITLSGGAWLKATPTGNIALVGLPSSVDVSADPTGLAPGSYSAKITVASPTASNKSVVVPVTLTVSAGKPVVSSVWPAGASVNTPDNVMITISGSYSYPTSTATLGGKPFATTYISSKTLMGTTPDLMATAGQLQVVVTTPTALSASTDPTTFWVYPPGPQILAVANTASYTANTVSPGGIITIYWNQSRTEPNSAGIGHGISRNRSDSDGPTGGGRNVGEDRRQSRTNSVHEPDAGKLHRSSCGIEQGDDSGEYGKPDRHVWRHDITGPGRLRPHPMRERLGDEYVQSGGNGGET